MTTTIQHTISMNPTMDCRLNVEENYKSKSTSSSFAAKESLISSREEMYSLRNYLSRCPSISADSEALQIAFSVLEELEVVDCKSIHVRSRKVTTDVSFSKLTSIRSHEKRISPATSSKNVTGFFPSVVHFMVDIPFIALFTFGVLIVLLHCIQTQYLSPQLRLMQFTNERRNKENTYYQRECDWDDVSTVHPEDLFIRDDFTAKECLDHIMIHGTSVYPDLLTVDTAKKLRSYILKRNAELNPSEAIYVIENANRWSFGIGANDDPIVVKALNEVSSNKFLRDALEKIVGKNPAVVELTTISAGYGATDQFWHPDVVSTGSSLKYSRSYVPTYNLFISLQDTTASMGATAICPGTHMCANFDQSFCEEVGIQISGEEDVWKTGYGVLMNQQNFHRGTAHSDPNAPTRVVFILTFAPRPSRTGETRQIGQGGSYSMRWDMWGHTLNDLRNASIDMAQPWAALRSMGLYKRKKTEWGWDYITQVSMRMANGDTSFSTRDLKRFVENGGLGLPSRMTPKFKDGTGWETYLLDHLLLWERIAIRANLIAFFIYAIVGLFVGSVVYGVKSIDGLLRRMLKALFRLIIIDCIIAALGISVFIHISETSWAKDIEAGRLFSPYFDDAKVTDEIPTRISTLVTVSDKLISSHYDSNDLASVSYFLDYHPGNRVFDAKVRDAAPLFSILNYDDKLKVIHNLIKEAQASGTRNLLQDQFGDWTSLTISESENYVARALSLYQTPLLSFLEKERNSMSSFYRNAHLKSTAMGSKFNVILIDNIVNKIFEEEIPFILKFAPFDPLKQRISSPELYRNSKNHMINFNFLPLHYPGRFHISQNMRILTVPIIEIQNRHRNPTFKNDYERVTESGILTESDFVDVAFGDTNEWYKAKILKIRHGSLIDVIYLDGYNDFGLTEDIVIPFELYTVDEIIEARKPEFEDSWQKAKVLQIASQSSIKVLYADGDVREIAHLLVRRFEHEYDLGDEVAFFQSGEQRWQKGEIVGYNWNETVDVMLENGLLEYSVSTDDLRGWDWFSVHV